MKKNGLEKELRRMDKYTTEKDSLGTKRWYKNGKKHREDGPAVEYYSGTKYWYREGKLHREDGPTIEYYNGEKSYYLEGRYYMKNDYYKYLKEIDDLPLEIQLTHEKEWVRERAKRNGR